MMLEIGANLFHTAVLFIIIWGITRFFRVLGQVAAAGQVQRVVKAANEKPIKFTK